MLITPRPSVCRAQEVLDVELGGAEERIGLLLLELDDLADDDPGGGGRDAAVLGHLGLALVRVEVVQQCAEVGEVDERQLLVIGVFEGQRKDRLLRLVEVQHLGQQNRAEAGDRCPQPDPLAIAVKGEELDRERLRCVVRETDDLRPGGQLLVGLGGGGQAADVALDVADEDRDAGVAQLLGEHLECLRLAGAGGTRHQPVPVHHCQRDTHLCAGECLIPVHCRAERDRRSLEAVAGRDRRLQVGGHAAEYRRLSPLRIDLRETCLALHQEVAEPLVDEPHVVDAPERRPGSGQLV